jgi:asparagine synthase (glutamine-hydrolysing)
MCGIAGWIDWQEDVSGKAPIIEAMIGRLSHRGPDAQNTWISRQAALAHHRLTVIDPHAGRQPMIYQAGEYTYVIVYNGELYNFRDLRLELMTRGHTFQSNSDTEVLLHTYLEWGEECPKHLNGIFAFGIWDESKQQLFLARDHIGVKPLFYVERGSSLLFASEIKALLAHPRVEAEVDADGLGALLAGVPAHTPGFTIYSNIYEVRPGEQIVFTRERKRVSRYWSLVSMPHTDSLETTTEHIRALLDDIVRRQLITDLPAVAMLSSNPDSSGLVALAAREFQREQKKPLHTYSIDFIESEKYFITNSMQASLDEPWVRCVSEYVGTEHHTITVDSAELVESLLIPVYAHDMPAFFGGLEASLYLHCKAMRQDATVALSGEAADEIFGGYIWSSSEEARKANTFPWQMLFGNQPHPWWSPEVTEKVRPQEYLARRYQEAREEVPVLEGEDAFHSKMREISYMDYTRFLPLLLDRKDRMSMAVGLEVRLPFCDYRLMEYVWNIPWEMKRVGGSEQGFLHHIFEDVLPNDVCRRRRSLYPTSQHLQYQQGISKWLLQILNDSSAPIRPLLNIPAVRALAEEDSPNLPGPLRVGPMEQIIKMNAWLQEYNIHIR